MIGSWYHDQYAASVVERHPRHDNGSGSCWSRTHGAQGVSGGLTLMTAWVRPEPFNRIRQGRRKRVANECHDNRVARDADPLLDQISAAGAGIGGHSVRPSLCRSGIPAGPLSHWDAPTSRRQRLRGYRCASYRPKKMMADSTRADPA
jgi:hypothetical protein